MQAKDPIRSGSIYLAYSARQSESTAIAESLKLLKGDAAVTPRERMTVLAEFARARADAQKLKEAARAGRPNRAPMPANEDIPA